MDKRLQKGIRKQSIKCYLVPKTKWIILLQILKFTCVGYFVDVIKEIREGNSFEEWFGGFLLICGYPFVPFLVLVMAYKDYRKIKKSDKNSSL